MTINGFNGFFKDFSYDFQYTNKIMWKLIIQMLIIIFFIDITNEMVIYSITVINTLNSIIE